MPFRITINGLPVECDTPGELLALTKRQSSSAPEIKQEMPARQARPVKPARVDRVKSERRGFIGNGKRLLETLKAAYPSSLTTTQLVDRIGVESMAIPAIMMGLRSRARHEGLDFKSLVIKEETSQKGRWVGSYQITEKGIEALQKYGH